MIKPVRIYGVKVNRATDGYWYVAIKTTRTGPYKNQSRRKTFDAAIDRVVALCRAQSTPIQGGA